MGRGDRRQTRVFSSTNYDRREQCSCFEWVRQVRAKPPVSTGSSLTCKARDDSVSPALLVEWLHRLCAQFRAVHVSIGCEAGLSRV